MTAIPKGPRAGAGSGVPEPAVRLRSLILGHIVSRAVQVAAELDLATYLRDGAKSATELAVLCGAHAPTLSRLMLTLVSLGVFTEQHGRFANNDASELLRSDVPHSLRAWARMFGAQTTWSAAHALMHSVRTGEPAFEHLFGEERFTYLSRHPDEARLFDEAMVSGSELINRAIIDAYDFSGFATLVDVAGGYGSTLCAILADHPGMKGTLFDLPHVVAKAQGFIQSKGLAHRCSLVPGSFLDGVPKGADAYFMKHILHDWDDERCLQLLRNSHEAMADHAKLLVCEKVLPEVSGAPYTRILDLVMLLNTPGGRERTEPEYRTLFEKTGFRLTRAIPTSVDNWILEAEKA
jgi:hypothetical protein